MNTAKMSNTVLCRLDYVQHFMKGARSIDVTLYRTILPIQYRRNSLIDRNSESKTICWSTLLPLVLLVPGTCDNVGCQKASVKLYLVQYCTTNWTTDSVNCSTCTATLNGTLTLLRCTTTLLLYCRCGAWVVGNDDH